MKKLNILFCIIAIIALTGCGNKKEEVVCTLSQNAYVGIATQTVKVKFESDKFKSADVVMEIKIDDDYKEYTSTYISSLESEYESLEELYNIKSDIKETSDGITVEFETDDASFEDLFGSIKSNSKKDVISSLETSGYTCNKK